MYIVYGIPNCNSVKKARAWLDEHNINYQFHDYKKQGITSARLLNWSRQIGWENLINKKGTTWRGLDETTQLSITGQDAAIRFLKEHTSAIKRPLIEQDDKVVVVRFDESEYEQLMK